MKRWVWFVGLLLLILVVLCAGLVWYVLFHRAPGQTFDSGGVPIYYTDQGAGEPVILLHGFAVQGDINWRRNGVIDALSKEFRVIVPDLRGHGRSGKPHDPAAYGVELAEDVIRLMDHLGLPKAHVVGYSMGAFVTLKLATLHPDRLITASPLGAGWEKPEETTFLAAAPELAAMLDAGEGIRPPTGMFGADRGKTGMFHTVFVKLMTRYMNDGAALGALLRSAPGLVVPEADLARLTMPMLALAGTRDPLRVGVDNLRAARPETEVVYLEDATHMSACARKEFLESIRSFLEKHRMGMA